MKPIPLCVDLDGTLIKTDLLIESVLDLIKRKPWYLLYLPLWIYRGKAYLKAAVASRVDFTEADFPLNNEVVDYVREQRQIRQTLLVSGSHQSLVDAVAASTDLFDKTCGSDEQTNLTGQNKRDWLVAEFGVGGFDYIGNDQDDNLVWPSAREALLVSKPNGIVEKTSIDFNRVFITDKPRLSDYLKLMRVHQWVKNFLILVPLFLGQLVGDPEAVAAIIPAFLAMSLLASATYIFNDMLDLQSDRENANKSKRALASGQISILAGCKLICLLMTGVLLLALMLPAGFNLMLGLYLLATLAYSFVLKRKEIVDVLMIAGLHTMRVIAGTVAIDVDWSFWLLAFSMFMFFSLALAKRVAELKNMVASGRMQTTGRGYHVDDIPVLLAMGVSSGLASILIIAMYINGDKVQQLYNHPYYLWLVCPIFMYWITRIWMKTSRGEMNEDPVLFAIRDRVSHVVALSVILIILAATVL